MYIHDKDNRNSPDYYGNFCEHLEFDGGEFRQHWTCAINDDKVMMPDCNTYCKNYKEQIER